MKKYGLVLLVSLLCCAASAQPPENKAPAGQLQDSKQLEEASRLNAAAVELYAKGQYNEAAVPAKRALEIREKMLTPDDGLVISAVLNLAEIQLLRDRAPEARSLFERALRSSERVFGLEDANLIAVLVRLAVADYRAGRPDETEKSFRRALGIAEKSFGAGDANTGGAVFQLAEFYQYQGEFKKAEPLYQRLITIREKSNAEKESTAEARDRYACLLRKTRRVKEAEGLEDFTPRINLPFGTAQAIEGGVVNGRAIELAQPPYPRDAKAGRISGKVKVRVLIDETGRVIRACAIEGPAVFMRATESAARRSRFTATLLSGSPVKVNGLIIYDFSSR